MTTQSLKSILVSAFVFLAAQNLWAACPNLGGKFQAIDQQGRHNVQYTQTACAKIDFDNKHYDLSGHLQDSQSGTMIADGKERLLNAHYLFSCHFIDTALVWTGVNLDDHNQPVSRLEGTTYLDAQGSLVNEGVFKDNNGATLPFKQVFKRISN